MKKTDWYCCVLEWHGQDFDQRPISEIYPDDAAKRCLEIHNDDHQFGSFTVLVALSREPKEWKTFSVTAEADVIYRAREI